MQLGRALETETERPLDRNVVVGEPGWPGHAEDFGTGSAFHVATERRGSASVM
jgi:hypothetical protein